LPVTQDFNRLLHRLADSGLDFVVIGGFAAVTHGSSLVTRDLDICALLTSENVEKLRAILADWHPRHRMMPQKLSFLEFPKSGPLRNLYLETDYGIVDILPSVLGVGDFERIRRNAEMFEIGGRRYQIISLPDLIRAKEALGREKDLLAAKELRAIAAKSGKSPR
jgi:predicted nucleotidyltransferase